MPNLKYTDLWIKDFNEKDVLKYDSKFKNKWNKNIKHRQQIKILKKYIILDKYWCDIPIGSGRIVNEFNHKNFLGCDLSDAFLEYNRKCGFHCEKVDIFKFGENYPSQFDIITTLNTIFAFEDFKRILTGQLLGLKKDGVFIVDIPNKLHSQIYKNIQLKLEPESSSYPEGMTRSEIEIFFNSLQCEVIEIVPHDFWDNFPMSNFWKVGNRITKYIKKMVWNIINFSYFNFRLFFFFNFLESFFNEKYFTKYMVVVKKLK